MGVALVTPFLPDKTIDYPALASLIDYQIAGKVDYLVALGTTSENPTLTPAERNELSDFIVKHVGGRVPLVRGCGGNDTAAVVSELKTLDLSPYSAILSVVPFYNKPSQEGIFRHYEAVAQASPLPVILYNVPGRTGVNMTADTTLRVAESFPSVVAIKEASGNLGQADEILRHKPDGFQVISGDDGMAYPLIAMGGVGVISVIGNAFPEEFTRMVHLALEGRFDEARAIHHKFTDLFSLLFVDGNPAGVKSVLHDMGMIHNELRLPLVPTRISTDERIRHFLQKFGKVSENM